MMPSTSSPVAIECSVADAAFVPFFCRWVHSVRLLTVLKTVFAVDALPPLALGRFLRRRSLS